MDFEQITTELADGVMTITLNRPDRLNAFTGTMGEELRAAFDRVDADDDVRAVIVTGAGRGFCAGADLGSGGDTFARREHEDPDSIPRDGGGRLTLRIFECTKPVIAAINGPAVGVGATMTLPMDVRLASESARIGFVFVRRGIVPEACSSWFLPRVVGISRAMEWVATGRVFPASEALEGGMIGMPGACIQQHGRQRWITIGVDGARNSRRIGGVPDWLHGARSGSVSGRTCVGLRGHENPRLCQRKRAVATLRQISICVE